MHIMFFACSQNNSKTNSLFQPLMMTLKKSNSSIWLTLCQLSLLWLSGIVQSNYMVAFSRIACLPVSLNRWQSGRQLSWSTLFRIYLHILDFYKRWWWNDFCPSQFVFQLQCWKIKQNLKEVKRAPGHCIHMRRCCHVLQYMTWYVCKLDVDLMPGAPAIN